MYREVRNLKLIPKKNLNRIVGNDGTSLLVRDILELSGGALFKNDRNMKFIFAHINEFLFLTDIVS
jgi:hypothetical protein